MTHGEDTLRRDNMSSGTVDPGLFQSLEWRLIGPFRGGRVVAVAGHPTEKATFYFGGVGGGIWKSTDAGVYWENISDGYLSTSAVGSLAVSESDPNVIYAGMGETSIRGNVSHGDGVYKSTDGGKTWKNVGLKDTRHIGRVRIHPKNPDIVYVAALGHVWGTNEERGVFRSTDGGQSWEKVLYKSDKAGAIDLSMDPNNPRILVASMWDAQRYPHQLRSGGEDSGIWRSTDGGDTWEDITRNPGLPKGVLGKIGVAISPAKTGRIWALVEAEDGALFRSDDGGDTWQMVSDNGDLRRRAWYYMHIYADPSDADTVWVLNLQCWKSIDGGKTFSAIPTPHGDNQDLWIDPQDSNRMIEGNDGGANVTLNGAESWSSIYNQPTAQFYHAIADNQNPYKVYGSQQDNTAFALPSRSANGAITMQEWMQPGGGESGYIAIRPDNPNIVYGGAIGSGAGNGRLIRYNHETFEERAINVWPEVTGMGRGAEALKYRFQWTFPIELSPFDPNVLYVTSNHVHKSTDEGMSWEVISPDLTRNDPGKLVSSGGPITADNTGAEAYCTIFAFKESSHEQGVFWAGSDDGLIHISRDGGNNWENITPPSLPEWALISVIELSPHDPATAYVAATRYKHNDNKPYLFKTNDYGKSWTEIVNGLPEDDFTRTIREDPRKRGLLYAGTESGVYVSFDDGANWQKFQLNLPVTPIHDLHIKNNDLIAATHGRAFWILDDLTPLHQIDGDVADKPAHLFKPRKTRRFRTLGRFGQGAQNQKTYGRVTGMLITGYQKQDDTGETQYDFLDAGKNPPNGVVIHYYLKDAPEGEVMLTILDEDDNEIKTFSSETKNGRKLTKKAGSNRFVWDMRYPDAKGLEGAVAPRGQDNLVGPVAVPGKYKAQLKVGGETVTQKFKIKKDKRIDASKRDLREQFDLLIKVRDKISELHGTVADIRSLRKQITGWTERVEDESVKESGTALDEKLKEIEITLVNPDATSPRVFPSGLNDKIGALTGLVSNADMRPTQQSYEVYEQVSAEIDEQIKRYQDVLKSDVEAFNNKLKEQNVKPVVV
jgi:photosystem II stability/assembly factor-like uncharacterized protein